MAFRPPCRWATYKGDCSTAVGDIVGPNTMNEWLTIVAAEYTPSTDTTRLGFSYGVQNEDYDNE